MGICASQSSGSRNDSEESAEKTRAIDMKLRAERTKESQICKLLLLGGGESGKSTLFKQIKNIYSQTPLDRETLLKQIQMNAFHGIITLSFNLSHFGLTVKPENQHIWKLFNIDLKDEEVADSEMTEAQRDGKSIYQLWQDPAIQQLWSTRNQLSVYESSGYFLDKAIEIFDPSYVPTYDDYFRVRVRTTGIVTNDFTVDGQPFTIVDVGGQRNERKKWIHCFDGVTAVIFVAAISEYDLCLFEDHNTNRLDEALKLFDEITNSRWFRETPILLFLNKRDLFNEKIMHVPLSHFQPSYTGPEKDPIAAQEFIAGRFKSRIRTPGKALYIHVTCATDTDNIRTVFTAVKDIIIKMTLSESGLLA